MKTFTVIAYDLPAGGHHVEAVHAVDATSAAVQLRDKLELTLKEFEVVAVINGAVTFVSVDHTKVALAPYTAASP